MPPKGSKGSKGVKSSKNRAQPYPTGSRQSARRVAAATGDGNPGSVPTPTTTGEAQQVTPNVQSSNQPVTPVITTQPRAPTVDIQPPVISTPFEPRPGTSSASMSDSVPHPQPQVFQTQVSQPQVIPQVSRQEFDSLKDTMTSMREMMASFMAGFNPSRNNNTNNSPNIPQPTHAFQQPASVPVQAVVTQQPTASTHNANILPVVPPMPVDNQQAAANIVDQAMAAHVQSITGDKAIGKPTGDKSYQLDRKLSQSLMQDIWEDNFVDLELLLDKKEDPNAPMVFKSVQTDHLGEIIQVMKPKPPKVITDIDQWSRAFDIYISMYTRKHHYQTHNLLTYSNKVKELAAKGGDFLRYDEEFRKMRARYGTPWETPDLELWVDCHQAALTSQVISIINSLNKNTNINLPFRPPTSNDTPDSPKKLRHPTGACYTFHNVGRCGRASCKFSHICYTPGCGQHHSVLTCPLRPGSGLAGHPHVAGGASSPPPRPSHPDNTR